MFLVGGGILLHGIPVLDHWMEALTDRAARLPGVGGPLRLAMSLAINAVTGIVAGALVLGVVSGARRLIRPRTAGFDPPA
jgi:predicted DNA repair protein MutK